MDINSVDLKRLEDQVYYYKPGIKSAEKKKYVSNKLQNQLLHSKAVVKIQRMDAECENLMISLKQRLMQLQDFLIPKNKEPCSSREQRSLKDSEELTLHLSSESSDEEKFSLPGEKNEETTISKYLKDKDTTQPSDTSESLLDSVPLALRRQPRERRLSYKSYNSSSTLHSRTNRKKVNKQEHAVTTSDVSFSSEEIVIEQEVDATPTIHIKIPSLHRGNVHYIILDSLNFARKVLDHRANEVKQEQNQKSILHGTKAPKLRKKSIKCATSSALQQLAQQEQELQLSQLIQDVMTQACNNDETLQATSALENINNNLINNYDLVETESFVNCSQSSQELSFSQHTHTTIEPICSTSESANIHKKPRKNAKRSNEVKQNEPPKKRGRKPKQKTRRNTIQAQPPTKSNLAQYVELFANDCELLPGSTTPAASSTKSQHLVSSTTHNYELTDHQVQEQQAQQSSQPITYYIDGDWVNGGPCQLITSNGESVEGTHHNTNENVPFQDFVNYIDDDGTANNSDMATVLECNHSLPVSIPRSVVNFTIQNKNPHYQVTHATHQSLASTSAQNSLLPIINIQIPPLPNNIRSTEPPPPAHTHKDVVDLSIKFKKSAGLDTEFVGNSDNSSLTVGDQCMPLDLSAGAKVSKEKILENNAVTIDTQDEEFIRHLIEQSDFEFRGEELKKGSDNEISVYDPDNNNNKSFKAALDMPLLEFDATELAKLVENTSNTCSQEQSILADDIVYNASTNNEDSNYVSMDAINSSVDDTLHFTNQSTTEIFNKLLDIPPDNHFLSDANNEFLSTDVLEDSAFGQCRMENSTMCELNNSTQKEAEKEVCKLNSIRDTQEIENKKTSSDPPSPSLTSVATQLDSSNSATDVVLSVGDQQSSQTDLHLKGPMVGEIDVDLCSDVPVCLISHRKQSISKSDNRTIDAEIFTIQQENEVIKVDKDGGEKSVLEENNEKNNITDLNSTDHKLESNDTQQQTNTDDANAESIMNKSYETYQENVVFSVSKISLSDDDNLYATDSDFSSGRSCDLNEHKFTEKENESLKDCAESVCKDLNLYSNEEEKFQNFESNVQQELSASTSKNLVYNEVKVPSAKVMETDTIIDLTPLELDSKLEGSLDFDEDFDDALSLATSCFASPNDERFEDSDSIVDTDTKDQPAATIKELQQIKIEPNRTDAKDLKYFKIPKLCPAADSSSAKVLSKPEPEGKKFCNVSPAKKYAAQPALLQNVEKITRTITNNLIPHLNADGDRDNLAGKNFANAITIAEKMVLDVFGVTCLPYLVDKCFDITHCQLSHHLKDVEEVYRKLNALDKTHVSVAYKILYNHSKLFEVYFRQFCIYYTNKNDRLKLLNMVNDCERYPEYAELIIDIYEGLVQCGLSRVNACRLVLRRIRDTSISTSIVETLIAMIMKSDWVMFSDFIEKYTQDVYQFNFRIGILEQMAPAVLNGKSSHLKQVFGKCVQTLHRDDTALLLNSPILIQCVALLTATT